MLSQLSYAPTVSDGRPPGSGGGEPFISFDYIHPSDQKRCDLPQPIRVRRLPGERIPAFSGWDDYPLLICNHGRTR